MAFLTLVGTGLNEIRDVAASFSQTADRPVTLRVLVRRVVGPCLLLAVLTLAASSALAANLGQERVRMKNILRVVEGRISKNFYDPSLKGTDWPAAVKEAEARIARAETVSDMITAIFVLVDRLKDSHTIFVPPGRVGKPDFGFVAMPVGDEVLVSEIVEKGAAEKAGLLRGDRIVTINGFAVQRATFSQMMLFFLALRPVTTLELQYLRGSDAPRKLVIEAELRDAKPFTDLTDEIDLHRFLLRVEGEREEFQYDTYDGDIGYLYLPSFVTASDSLHSLARKIKEPKAMIVDLRGNGGGVVRSFTEFAGHFVTRLERVATITERAKEETIEIAPRQPSLVSAMYVLVDAETASAAELFARHFQRTVPAVVIGDRTAGRVNAARIYSERIGVDTIVPFAVSVTVGQIRLPDNQMLEGVGVMPDKLCLPTAADLREEKDPCLDLALSLAREKLGIKPPNY